MLVKVFKLGEQEPVAALSQGCHILGRGPVLQCNDKRVSRNHATIEITPDNVKLTSLHINPCFLRLANSKTITILSKDTTTQLNDGDTFAFLPEDFWFKIQILEDVSNTDNTKSEVTKREIEDNEEDAPPDKRTKLDESANKTEIENRDKENDGITEEVASTSKNEKLTVTEKDNISKTLNEDETTKFNNGVINEENPDLGKEINDNEHVSTDNLPQNSEVTSSQNNNDKIQDPANDEIPGPSHPKPRRERCWYGAECYRKNPIHRQEYTHPGDSDFESDPEDNRPICPYGVACYRKNQDHRKNYKHPPRQRPSKKKRTSKKVKRFNVADSQDLKDLDLSDSEDPFIADDDSDEYEGDSDDEDDTDWEESQDAEDGENFKRLVKEAKRFTKN